MRGGVTHIDSKVTGDFLALDSDGTAFNRKGESFPGTPKWAAIGDVELEFPVSSGWGGFVGGNAAYRSDSRTFFADHSLYEIPGYTLDAVMGRRLKSSQVGGCPQNDGVENGSK